MSSYFIYICVIFFRPSIHGNDILETDYNRVDDLRDFLCIDGLLREHNNISSKIRCASLCSAQRQCVSFFYDSTGGCRLHDIKILNTSNCISVPTSVYYINIEAIITTSSPNTFTSEYMPQTSDDSTSQPNYPTDLNSTPDQPITTMESSTDQFITTVESTSGQPITTTESTHSQPITTMESTHGQPITTMESTSNQSIFTSNQPITTMGSTTDQSISTSGQPITTMGSTTDQSISTSGQPITTMASTPGPITTQVYCDTGWLLLGSGCYKFTPPDETRVIWTEAIKICTEQGGYLTVIESTDENEVLKGHIASYGSVDFWIGGSDLATEGTFIWNHTNQIVNLPDSGLFHDWYPPNQPDNGNGGTEQHCMAFYGGGGYKWNDVNCAVTRRFVCERDPS